MSDTKTKNASEPDQKISQIMAELAAHNEYIGADDREPDRLLSDARFVAMHRHSGISVETICMMLTDTEFAYRKLKAINDALLAACKAARVLYDNGDVLGIEREDSHGVEQEASYQSRTLDLIDDAIAKAEGK